jgi:hypothetical protein
VAVQRKANGQLVKGATLSPKTTWKPGESGNQGGMRHKIRCQRLIEELKLDEEMAMIAAGQGRYKKTPCRDRISAYAILRDSAFGRPATIQIANFNEVQFCKRLVGVPDDAL